MKSSSKKKNSKPIPQKPIQEVQKEDSSPRVFYKVLPDHMILIARFSNFMTDEQIIQLYGADIQDAYSRCPNSLSYSVLNGVGHLQGNTFHMTEGKVIERKTFDPIIKKLKLSGKILHELVDIMHSGPLKSIKI